MADKTNTDLIRDLTTLADKLDERLNSARDELEWLSRQHEIATAQTNDLRVRVERIDTQLTDARRDLAERSTRGWTLGISVLSALLAAALSFGVQRYLLAK